MKKYILLSLLLAFFASSYSQSVRIVLQTRLNYEYVEFDSIVLINTRTLDTLRKYYPDTILYSSTVGINDYQSSPRFGFESHFRNPYSNETEVTLNVTIPERITISLNDISGRLCNSYSQVFNPGIYKFKISAMKKGFFILNAKSKTFSNSIKLVQTDLGSENLIQLLSESQSDFSTETNSLKSDDSDFFNIGDKLIVRSYYKNKYINSFCYANRNGYFIRDFFDDVTCDSIDFIGRWYILVPSSINSYQVKDEKFLFEAEVNFISDSVYSTTTLSTPSENSIWISGDIGVTQYYKYKLFPINFGDYPFSVYPMNTNVSNITSYTNSTYSFHFYGCKTILLIPGTISYFGSNTLIRDPY